MTPPPADDPAPPSACAFCGSPIEDPSTCEAFRTTAPGGQMIEHHCHRACWLAAIAPSRPDLESNDAVRTGPLAATWPREGLADPIGTLLRMLLELHTRQMALVHLLMAGGHADQHGYVNEIMIARFDLARMPGFDAALAALDQDALDLIEGTIKRVHSANRTLRTN